MKRFLSIFLAVITAMSLALPAFAAEETTKNVDNTFDNFEPAPGTKAPDNWYDPYCYEADGRINKYCLNYANAEGGEGARYCPIYKKIFTVSNMGRYINNDKVHTFSPYEVVYSNLVVKDAFGEIKIIEADTQWYCPYCGKYQLASYVNDTQIKEDSAIYNHEKVFSVLYGFNCDKCNTFVCSYNFANNRYETSYMFTVDYVNFFSNCHDETNVNEVKLYRFLSEEQRKAEYSFIFTETEQDFGDGKDGCIEDLKKDKNGNYSKWDSPDNPYQKLTFWQKLINFFKSIFKNIADFFNRLFK